MYLLWSATFIASAMLFLLAQNCGVLLQHHFQALADIGCHCCPGNSRDLLQVADKLRRQ